jgi:dTDP-4-amino-4,6-dideoxygalactose transaminase
MPTADRRFAATSFGIKTRIAPMSAALGRSMLARLPETNSVRNHHHKRLAATLEDLGFECFLPPEGVERVWFEFIIRHRMENIDAGALVEWLQQAGCRVGVPRYPLLHQQPYFTEGHWRAAGRYPESIKLPASDDISLPFTERMNHTLLRLPNFNHPDAGALVDQYAEAFRQAVRVFAS